MGLLVVAAVLCSAAAAAPYDVLIYDASSGGVAAAVAAARHGSRTALLCASWPACFEEGGRILGGMSTGGLGKTDIGSHPSSIGGLAEEFYHRNWRHYERRGALVNETSPSPSCRLPSTACNVTYNLEPHVAQRIFEDMLAEAGVDVAYDFELAGVTVANATVVAVTAADGRRFAAAVFIDASYEGDLMARAGVGYAIGREPSSKYNETLAGRQVSAKGHYMDVAIDPYVAGSNGSALLPFLTHDAPAAKPPPGGGDGLVQAYNFRLCVTKDPKRRVPFAAPVKYDPADFELVRRWMHACGFGASPGGAAGKCHVGFPTCCVGATPSGKADMNNCGGVSTDLIGGSWRYPAAGAAERKAIWRRHRYYTEGLLFTLAADPAIAPSVHAAMAEWGYCGDEFPATGHFAPALYVREARRLTGAYVFTQNSPSPRDIGAAAVGLGCYTHFDSHNADRFACSDPAACYGATPPLGPRPRGPYVWNEGDVETRPAPSPYQIPAGVMYPKQHEARNLLVVGALSASHIGFSTLRMEPQFMIIGHAAGVNAAMAAAASGAVQDVSPQELQAALVADGQKVRLPS